MFKKYKSSLNKALNTIKEDQVEILYQEIKQRLDGTSSIHILGNGGSAANESYSWRLYKDIYFYESKNKN